MRIKKNGLKHCSGTVLATPTGTALEAIPAVDRLGTGRPKRNLGADAARRADDIIQLSLAALPGSALFLQIPAGFAFFRILEAFGLIKGLFIG